MVLLPRVLGDATRRKASEAASAAEDMGQRDLAVDSEGKYVLRERGGMDSAGNSGSGQGSSNTTAAIYASGEVGRTRPHAGDDGVDGTCEEGREDMDDMRGDSGMTMDGYDPNTFKFPRRINDEMATVLSPTPQTLPSSISHGGDHSNEAPTTTLSPEANISSSQQLTMEKA